jgi:hypothetical protein
MKSTDIVPEGADLYPWKSNADKIREMGERGATTLRRIEDFMRLVHRQPAVFAEARAKMTAGVTDLNYLNMVNDALTNGMSPSVPGFERQLTLVGDNFYRQLLEDPANRHLAQTMVTARHQETQWVKYGMNAYNLTSSLAAGLVLTEPLPLTTENFALPFPTFTVYVPDGYIPYFYRNDEQVWANVIWMHSFKSVERPDVTVYQITVEYKGSALFWREPIERLLKYNVDSQLQLMDDDPVMTAGDGMTLSVALRIVRNLVSWVHTHKPPKPAPPGGSKKKKSARSEPKDRLAPLTWFLGREVKFGPEIRKMAQESALGLNKRTAVEGWKVRIQHVVQGHWKSQFHGPQRALRKTIWVAPYWRGPEGTEAWAHMYVPNEPKEK